MSRLIRIVLLVIVAAPLLQQSAVRAASAPKPGHDLADAAATSRSVEPPAAPKENPRQPNRGQRRNERQRGKARPA